MRTRSSPAGVRASVGTMVWSRNPPVKPRTRTTLAKDDGRLPASRRPGRALPADRDRDEDADAEHGQRRRLDPADRVHRLAGRDPGIDGVRRGRVGPPGDGPDAVGLGQRPGALHDDEADGQPAVDGTEEPAGRVGQDEDREQRVEPAVEDGRHVGDTEPSDAIVRSPANQAKPVRPASGPMRLPGRRSQMIRPAAIIDQPTARSARMRAAVRSAVRVSW